MRDITPLVAPTSIAVIGASSSPYKAGGMLFKNLVDGQFSGTLYPINANAMEVMGLTAYPSVEEVPDTVDLVYVVVPRQYVEEAIRQCVRAGARAACIVTAGFRESGDEGRAAEEKILEIAKEGGLLLAGPNTIGMVNAHCGMMGSFVPFPNWEKGGVSLFAQTGIFTGGVAIYIMEMPNQRLPMSKSIDVGNKIDVDEIDFLDYAERDPDTKVVAFYIERVDDEATFLSKAEALRQKKPIVVLRPGATAEGAEASVAHTGTPATDRGNFDAELERRGIVRVTDEQEFTDSLRALAYLPKANGKRVGIATTSGALGVMSTDLVVQHGLTMSSFDPATIERLRPIFPEWMEPANPCDFWVSVDIHGSRQAHEVALTSVFADPNVDMVLCTLLAAATADFPEFGPLLRNLRATHEKPVAVVIYGGADRDRWLEALEGGNIPVFLNTRAAVRALADVAHATL